MPTNADPRQHAGRSISTPESVTEKPERDRETRRELAKLTANYANAVAASIFAIGAFAPVAGFLLQSSNWVGGL